MTARDDYPYLSQIATDEAPKALAEIDRLRAELERCERLNERLRKACDEATSENVGYRRALRFIEGSRR